MSCLVFRVDSVVSEKATEIVEGGAIHGCLTSPLRQLINLRSSGTSEDVMDQGGVICVAIHRYGQLTSARGVNDM